MAIELKVPEVGESIQEVQIASWLKEEGQWVEKDEDVVELETDKASVQIPAPAAGFLQQILKPSGEFAEVGETIAQIVEGERPEGDEAKEDREEKRETAAARGGNGARQREASKGDGPSTETPRGGEGGAVVMPAAERLLAEHGLSAREVSATGPGGRLLKEDVLRHVESRGKPAARGTRPSAAAPQPRRAEGAENRQEEVVPMSMIRRRIADRLVQAQQTAALLTTVNEVDMTEVMELRASYKEMFQKKYDVKLGFMSFFIKASIEALKRFPQVNAEIRDRNIVYKNYYDVGVAVGGGKGLVVPVLRNSERMSFAEIERTIEDLAQRAQQNALSPSELEGGTFTISNGGIYGSLLSSPIVNPPQSGILGMHAIQQRPVARNGEVVIRPMMYIALTYDHRLVDGREAVTFLRTIKEIIEDPARLFLEV